VTQRSRKGFFFLLGRIVHTVGPVWRGGNEGEPELLASCYRCSLEAMKVSAQTIAFPSISTGIFGYPIDQATEVALAAVQAFDGDLAIRLVAFSPGDFDVIENLVRSARERPVE
jgi:O-acetyl-ADP-ribose deacetylase